jgi:ubiquinone biosynthesis protein UbiJ
MLIKPILISALESAVNRYLKLDTQSTVYLEPLAGKIIALTIEPFAETIYLCPSADSIQCLDYSSTPPDTEISGSLWALGLMGLSAKPLRAIFSGSVKINGDTHTGRKFQDLFAKLDIDLESKLAQYTGEGVAHQIGQFFRSTQQWSRDSLETLSHNTSEFLQDETQNLPAGPEIDIFYRQVDELRTDFDRLQSKISRLENTLSITDKSLH